MNALTIVLQHKNLGTESLDRLYCGLLFKDIYEFVLSFIPSYTGLCSTLIMTLVIIFSLLLKTC